MKIQLNQIRGCFLVYLAALVAFAPFSTDVYLSAMPVIRELFQVNLSTIQLTLSLFFISFAIAQLIWGPLSDVIGRRAVIFMGLSIYVVGSLICMLSCTIHMLLIGRVIQALGSCAGIVMAIAIVKDSFHDENELSSLLSTMMSIAIIAPMIAPLIGSYLLTFFTWRANFCFLLIYGIVLLLATFFFVETHPAKNRHPLPAKKLMAVYYQQASFAPFLWLVLAVATNFCVMFTFICTSPFIYMKLYHLSAIDFGYLFALNALALVTGCYSLKVFKKYIGSIYIVTIVPLCMFLAALVMLLAMIAMPQQIGVIIIANFVSTFGVGLLYPELTSMALQHVIKFNGIASSLLGTARFALAALIAVMAGSYVTRSALPLPVSMLVLNGFSLLFIYLHFYAKKRCI